MHLSSTLVLSILMAPYMVSCRLSNLSCRSLINNLNMDRRINELDPINGYAFIKAVGGEEECKKTLQKIFEYAEKSVTKNVRQEDTWKLSREQIKVRLSHSLRGMWMHSLVYDENDPNNLFFTHLKKYFADDSHDNQQVTVKIHTQPVDLSVDINRENAFQEYYFEPGVFGEAEFMVPVINVPENFFLANYNSPKKQPNPKLQLRHLDLMMASLVINKELKENSAVLVSGFQSPSLAFGQPVYNTGANRKLLFLDSQKYTSPRIQQNEIFHEWIKTKAGFSALQKGNIIETLCLNEGNNQKLHLLIQLLAAAEFGHKIVFRVPRPNVLKELRELIEFLNKVTNFSTNVVLRTLLLWPELNGRHTTLDSEKGSKLFLQSLQYAQKYLQRQAAARF